METTRLYIELIIIGLESFAWISICVINIIGNKVLSYLHNILNNFSSSLLLIGILYIIGVLIDRLADMIFQKSEDKIRNASGLKAKSSFLIWKKYDARKYSDYARSKIRILRASIINIPLLTMSVTWYILKYFKEPYTILIFILFLGTFFTYISCRSYNLSVKRYYDKACALETSGEKDEKAR